MRYSLEPHYRRYIQGQGFISFARNIEIDRNIVLVKIFLK